MNDPTLATAFADGTFKSSPPNFTQIWIVRITLHGVNIPVLYALLENKTEISYTAVLQFLKRRCPRFDPDTFVVDFEAAEHNAIQAVYPDTRIQGCHFHYCQALKDRINKLPGIKEDAHLSQLMGCFYAIPFLPLHDVEDGYHILENNLLNYYPAITSESQRFLEYYERTWIQGQSHTHPANWNVVLSTLEGTPRTNNPSEGSNNALNQAVGGAKPTLATLIIKLRQFNARKEMRVLQLQQHPILNSDEKPRKNQRMRNSILLGAVNTYNRTDMFSFLKRVGVQY